MKIPPYDSMNVKNVNMKKTNSKNKKQTVKTVSKTDSPKFQTISDETILRGAQEFIDMRKQFNAAKDNPLCPVDHEPLEQIDFIYENRNFRFYLCRKCQASPDPTKDEPVSSFWEFIKTLEVLVKMPQESTEKTNETAALEGLGSLFG